MRSLIKPAEAATCFALRVLNKLQFISSFKLCHLHQISIQHAEPSVLKGTSQSIEMSFKKQIVILDKLLLRDRDS